MSDCGVCNSEVVLSRNQEWGEMFNIAQNWMTKYKIRRKNKDVKKSMCEVFLCKGMHTKHGHVVTRLKNLNLVVNSR